MENQYLHDRMMSILRQRAANGEGYDSDDDYLMGEGGPPKFDIERYKKYYIKHNIGPINDKAIKKAYDNRMLGIWAPRSRGAVTNVRHIIPRPKRTPGQPRKARKPAAKKGKTTRKRSATKKSGVNYMKFISDLRKVNPSLMWRDFVKNVKELGFFDDFKSGNRTLADIKDEVRGLGY